jgi:hypothetical protein
MPSKKVFSSNRYTIQASIYSDRESNPDLLRVKQLYCAEKHREKGQKPQIYIERFAVKTHSWSKSSRW